MSTTVIKRGAAAGLALAAMTFVAQVFPAAAASDGAWKTSTGNGATITFANSLTVDARPDSKDHGASLVARCRDGQLGAGLFMPTGPASPNVNVSLMIDDLPPWQETWPSEPEIRLGIGLWNSAEAKPFLTRLHAGERLTVQFAQVTGMSTYSYDLIAGRSHLETVAAACGENL